MRKIICIAMCVFISASNVAYSQVKGFKTECGIGYIKKMQQHRGDWKEGIPLEIELDTTGITQIGVPKDTKITITPWNGVGTYYEYNSINQTSNMAVTAMQYRLPVRLASLTDSCTGYYYGIVVQVCTDETTCRN
jgi:hypothetical protein